MYLCFPHAASSLASLAQGTNLVCPRGSLAGTQAPLPLSATKRWGGRSFWDSLPFCTTTTTILPAKLLKGVTHQRSDPKKIPVQLQRRTFKSTIFCILWGKGRSMSSANLSSDWKRHLKTVIDLQCHFVSQTKMWSNKYVLSSSFTEAVFHFDWWF